MPLSTQPTRSRPLLAFVSCAIALAPALAQDEVPRATPVPPKAVPINPAPDAKPVPAGDAPIIRPDAEQNAIDYANLVYSKNYFDMAVGEFESYLRKFPTGDSVDVARYRLAESLREEKRLGEAEKEYLKVLGIKGSQYAAPAAYRLASLYYNRKDFRTAAPYFSMAESSPKKSVQLSAGYYRARSLKMAGDAKGSIAGYQKIADIEGENDYREASLLAIGRMQAEGKDDAAALAAFSKLAGLTVNADYKAEALVMAGMLSSKLKKPDDAKSYFERAMNLEGGDEWKPDAQYQLIKTFTEEGDFKKVIDIYKKGRFAVPDVLQPNMLLMVGKALREEKRFASAIQIYMEVEERFPSSDEAFEAAYRKLFCFLSSKNSNLPGFVNLFVTKYENRHAGHKYFDMALLMKAESLFGIGSFGAAATAYSRIDVDRIPEAVRASALYKGAWSFSENGSHAQAVRLFSQYLDRYPQDARVPTALAKRALSYRAVEDFPSALKDLARIIKHHQGSEPLELAYQQTALIMGQQRDYQGMIDAYAGLMKNFPGSRAIPEAQFWTGWGYFEIQKFEEAIGPLKASRESDGKVFYDRATMRIILANYSLRNVEGVREEIDGVRKGSRVVVPAQVYSWLGVKLFELGDFPGADTYMTRASTPQSPESTRPIIWKQLGLARLKTKSYKRAIASFDFYLQSNQPAINRAKVLLEKGRSQLALKAFDDADKTIEEGLQLQPQGRVNAELCLVWGDIAIGRKDYDAAIKRLIRPSYVFSDGAITPLALDRTILAHEKLGNSDRADEVRKTLQENYPKFKRTETAQVGDVPE